MTDLTHFNSAGDAHMVDVSEKSVSHRIAVARGSVRMQPQTLDMIARGKHKKGDVLGIARVAGIMAAKKTSMLIPLCHPIPITKVEIDLRPEHDHNSVTCTAQVETLDRTGVEMEALTAVQIALLTIYDMCKSVDRGMTMEDIGLVEKSGGTSGHWKREP